MKKLLKQRILRQAGEFLVVFVLLWAIVGTSIMPQVVEAKTLSLSSLKEMFMDWATSTPEVSFPEVGDAEPRNTIWVTMTAYSSEVGQTDSTPCIPADWTFDLCENYEKYGLDDTIAANFLPLGTQVRFPDLYGDKIFVVRDRMNARYGYGRGDFWMPSRELAVNFGVQRIRMEVYYR